jgi:hypothetical protein
MLCRLALRCGCALRLMVSDERVVKRTQFVGKWRGVDGPFPILPRRIELGTKDV